MTISDIYLRYTVPPQLQSHQYKVAAIAQIICDSIPSFPYTKLVVTTCLLHDIGNLSKSIIETNTDWVQEKGYQYWKSVQADFISNWGEYPDMATKNIVSDLKLNPLLFAYLNSFLSLTSEQAWQTKDLGMLICKYADQRVNPEGLVTLEARIAYLADRYPEWRDPQKQKDTLKLRKEIESYISSQSSLDVSAITAQKVDRVVNSLYSYVI